MSLLVVLTMTGASQAGVLDGLNNYWNFDNNLNDTAPGGAVTDNGTFDGLNGTDGIGYGPGLFTAGIELNGSTGDNQNDGYVRIPQSEDTLYGGGSVTTSLWVKTSGVDTGWQTILAHGEGSQYRLARRAESNPPIAAYAGGSGDIPGDDVTGPAIGDTDGASNGWHHVVGVSEAGVSTRLWVDGILVATGDAPTIVDDGNSSPAAPDLFIGANPQTGDQNREWWGEIDDVGIWGRALSESEILQIYDAGNAGIPLAGVPEPSTALLSLLGLFGLAGLRKRS